MAEVQKPTLIKKLMRVPLIRSATRRVGGDMLVEQLCMYDKLGYWPRLNRPRSVNEHLARQKLVERDQRIIQLGDKLGVRDYVRERVGPHVLSTVYAQSTTAEGIDLDALPNAFALKPTHGTQWRYLVTDKSKEDLGALRAKMAKWLKARHGRGTHEWWYKKMTPRVFAEELLVHPEHPTPPELKFWVFGGKARCLTYHHDRTGAYARIFLDPQWNVLPFGRPGKNEINPPPPAQLPEMIRIAERLGESFRFARVDLYAMPAGRIVLGEMTFCPAAARGRFEPMSADFEVGRWWHKGPVTPLSPEPFVPGPGAWLGHACAARAASEVEVKARGMAMA